MRNYEDGFRKASNPPPGNGLEGPVLPVGVGVEGVAVSGTKEVIGLTSAASRFSGGLLKTGSGPQKSAVGVEVDGGDCVGPPGVFFNGTELCFLGFEPAPRLGGGGGEPGWKLSSGRLKFMSWRGVSAA